MVGSSKSNLSRSLNDIPLFNIGELMPPASAPPSFLPPRDNLPFRDKAGLGESFPVRCCTTDLKFVASVSIYSVLMITTFTGSPLLDRDIVSIDQSISGLNQVRMKETYSN
ncbi:hypothetical protein Hanom_Chr06g00543221 [Helianthus anomalus]